jgi:hypothetical protein
MRVIIFWSSLQTSLVARMKPVETGVESGEAYAVRIVPYAPARLASVLLALLCGCNPPGPIAGPTPYARAEQVEMTFRGQSFVLGDDTTVAKVSPVSGASGQVLRLPFWLGTNVLVPGVLQPTEGDYYVVSEAVLVKPIGGPDEWLIEAGSSLIKKETVLITSRTRFRPPRKTPETEPRALPKMLPMIVQFAGMRKFTRGDGTTVDIPVLREVSLPMKWTLGGPIPGSYARFEVR